MYVCIRHRTVHTQRGYGVIEHSHICTPHITYQQRMYFKTVLPMEEVGLSMSSKFSTSFQKSLSESI